jgi:phosphoglycerate dehydrogenase-like enzyme
MIKSVFLSDNPAKLKEVFGDGRFEKVCSLTDCCPDIITSETFYDYTDVLRDADVVFSSWGMLFFTDEMFEAMPSLKAVFYAAGSVRGFAEPMINHGARVSSAWNANAVPVAEFTVAQIILSCKRYFSNAQACKVPERRLNDDYPVGPGGFGETVALIGCGMIACNVIRILKDFCINIVVVDPYLPDSDVAKLGVTRVSLEEAFAKAYVVSNHLPNIPPTVGILNGALFESMREGATFINTGRGAQVVESEFIEVLTKRPDITALLDVTHPEPPESDSAFYSLPNVHLSSHIAGSLGNELVRMADSAIEEFKRWSIGEPMLYEITAEMLRNMA